MKILSLNTWHGERIHELKEYLFTHLDTVDIFCFQESNGENIERILLEICNIKQFSSVVATKITDSDRHYSLTTLVKKPLKLMSSQTLLDDNDAATGQALATTIVTDTGQVLTVVNVHGVPFVQDDKLDTTGRLHQTEQIITYLSTTGNSPSVVCGDFNLLPETQSVTKFASAGYQNLIADYSIPTTRNKYAWKLHPVKQYFADYTFASNGIQVTDFAVPTNEVSDHLPMVVTFEH